MSKISTKQNYNLQIMINAWLLILGRWNISKSSIFYQSNSPQLDRIESSLIIKLMLISYSLMFVPTFPLKSFLKTPGKF